MKKVSGYPVTFIICKVNTPLKKLRVCYHPVRCENGDRSEAANRIRPRTNHGPLADWLRIIMQIGRYGPFADVTGRVSQGLPSATPVPGKVSRNP